MLRRFIENMEPHVEAPEHFYEPLVHKRFRDQHQDPVGPSAEQQAMEDETGLDGLSKSHFVQEHYARGVPVGDLLGDIELVRNEVNAAAEKSAHRGLARAVEQLQSAAAQLKRCRGIKGSRKQTLLRPPETEAVAPLGFGQPVVFADVNQQASLLDDLFDNELLFLTSSDLVARPKAHALKRRMLCGISARFADRFKLDQDATFLRMHDRGQPELRLRLADPPLAYDEPTHENAAGCMRVLPDKRNL